MTAIYTKDCLMELNSEIVTTPPRDASTVVLLRDSAQGLQILMMQRHSASQVLGGVHVFPGGKLDDDDMSPLVLKWLKEDSAQLHRLLQEPGLDQQRAAGLYVAALRELHEEAGILLGSAVASAPPSEPWHQVVSSLGHKLQATLLTPWSRWITPKQPSVTNKRFDTRFFLAHAEPQVGGRSPRDDCCGPQVGQGWTMQSCWRLDWAAGSREVMVDAAALAEDTSRPSIRSFLTGRVLLCVSRP